MSKQVDFILKIAPIIQKEAFAHGYHVASPIIAQACLESRYGASDLSKKYHNYFGLKCGSKWKGPSVNMTTKEEYKKHDISVIKDNFRVYNSIEDGVKGYFDFIANTRYANLKGAATASQYLNMIKEDGYATDYEYVYKNMTIVNTYGLTKYDYISIKINPYMEPVTTITFGSTGEGVKWLQYALNEVFYSWTPLKVDGDAGPKTIDRLKTFQRQYFLTVDGIFGPKSKDKLKKALHYE